MRRFFIALSLATAALGLSPAALAEPTRTLESVRIRLGEIAETTDTELAAVDLGAAPPPAARGSFRARTCCVNCARKGSSSAN